MAMWVAKWNGVSRTNSICHIVGVPKDGVATNSTQKIHEATTTIFVLLATAGNAFALFCLIFNFYFRDKKYLLSVFLMVVICTPLLPG